MVPATDQPMAVESMTGGGVACASSLVGAGEPGVRVPSCMPQFCFRLMVVSHTKLDLPQQSIALTSIQVL